MTMDEKQKVNINLPQDVAEGQYANLAIISHSSSEFVIDFVRMMPNVQTANVKSRIILTPEHALRLLGALGENIERYEKEFGPIKSNNQPMPPFGFSGTKGNA